MFFKKNKKIDARIRFQQQGFRRELAKARQYKRVPQVRVWEGKDTKSFWSWRKVVYILVALACIGGVSYLLFFPNFLFIKQVTIQGVSESAKLQTESTISRYLDERTLSFPNKNIVLLRTDNLATRILERDLLVYKIEKIKRNIWERAITISLVPRTEELIAEYEGRFFTISNDGKVMRILPEAVPGLVRVQATGSRSTEIGAIFFENELLTPLVIIARSYTEYTGTKIDHLELVPLMLVNSSPVSVDGSRAEPVTLALPPQEIIVYSNKESGGHSTSFKVFLDLKGGMEETMEKLRLLLDHMPQDRFRALAYIDMRFKNKGFVCLTSAPCAKEILPPSVDTAPEEGVNQTSNGVPPPPPK